MKNFNIGNKYVGINLTSNIFSIGFFPFVLSISASIKSLRISITFFNICLDVGLSKTFNFE
jgi:hypothetical protein